MKERPILFNSEMVRAILEGRKTQTRRVSKAQHLPGASSSFKAYEFERILPSGKEETAFGFCGGDEYTECVCPYGKPGDRLWVREKWAPLTEENILYKDMLTKDGNLYCGPLVKILWKPSIHMPRWASRILLEITEVRVERVQEITDVDAIAEGALFMSDPSSKSSWSEGFGKACFRKLWDSINEKRGFGWDVNPWVWVVTFKRTQQLISGDLCDLHISYALP